MKFIIIIITLVIAYYLINIRKRSKEKQNMATNNMVLCLECGYHVPKNCKCNSSKEVSECRNKK